MPPVRKATGLRYAGGPWNEAHAPSATAAKQAGSDQERAAAVATPGERECAEQQETRRGDLTEQRVPMLEVLREQACAGAEEDSRARQCQARREPATQEDPGENHQGRPEDHGRPAG